MHLRHRIAATVSTLLVSFGGAALYAQPAHALNGTWVNTNGDANNKVLPFVGSTPITVKNSGVVCVLGTVRKAGTWTAVSAEVYLAQNGRAITSGKTLYSTAETIGPWNESRTSPLFTRYCWQNLTPGITVNLGYTAGRANSLGRYDIVSVKYANPTR